MKKVIVVMLALFLAVPALSFAGSATSRFDLTVGGAVSLNFGYMTRNSNDAPFVAPRDNGPANKNLAAEYGNTYVSAADSVFNFTVRGPDLWGAKTSAFLQVDFRGGNTGNSFGGAQIQYARINFDWPGASLLIGQWIGQFGTVWGRDFIYAGDLGAYDPITGSRPFQIAYRYNFTKQFNGMIGLLAPTQWTGSGPAAPPVSLTGPRSWQDGYARSGLPILQGEIGYENDACGRIGANMLRFGLGGMVGKEIKPLAPGVNALVAGTNRITDSNVPVWMTAFRAFVPIIPEKKQNKGGAFFFTGTAFIGQNLAGNSWVGPGGVGTTSAGSYWRPNDVGTSGVTPYPTEAASPTMYGGFAQLTYYFTDTTRLSGQFGMLKYNYSNWARNAASLGAGVGTDNDWKGPNALNMNHGYGLILINEPTPALRFAIQWNRVHSNYNNMSNGGAPAVYGAGTLDSQGTLDHFKGQVVYFF